MTKYLVTGYIVPDTNDSFFDQINLKATISVGEGESSAHAEDAFIEAVHEEFSVGSWLIHELNAEEVE